MNQTTVLFLGLAVICWGLSAFFDKLCFRYFPGPASGTPAPAPLAQATDVFFVRLALTILILLVPVVVKWHGVCGAAAGAQRMGLFWVASSVVAAMSGVYFYLIAMSGAEASRIVPLSSTYPLVTFLLAVMFLGEGFNLNKLLGTLFVCLGVFFLSR